MNININLKSQIQFKDITPNTCFMLHGTPFLKLQQSIYKMNAINLRTSVLVDLYNESFVIPVSATLTIED